MRGSFKSAVVFGSAAAGALVLYNSEDSRRFVYSIPRISRVVWAAALISADLKWTLRSAGLSEAEKSKLHSRNAKRLLNLFERNGGVYIKIGQHLATLNYILPPEYHKVLSVLYQEAPRSSKGDIERVFREETGRDISSTFAHFDFNPIGTASLAQVHKARLANGDAVAVKIQHRSLRYTAAEDIFVVSNTVLFFKKFFKSFPFDWLVKEMKENLPKELDFALEGRNSERVSLNLKRFPVIIPKVHWEYTTKRVLVMELVEGTPINDLSFYSRNNIKTSRVVNMLNRIVGEMIFVNGFVHCDPHPGNVLVQLDPTRQNSLKLVLLDHGLYREISKDLQLKYARLWSAILSGNLSRLRTACVDLGGGDAFKLISCILTQKNWENIEKNDLMSNGNLEEREKMRRNAVRYFPEVVKLLSKVPSELLLLLKTNDIIRDLERQLLIKTHFNSFLVFSLYAQKPIQRETIENAGPLVSWLYYLFYAWKNWAFNLLIAAQARI